MPSPIMKELLEDQTQVASLNRAPSIVVTAIFVRGIILRNNPVFQVILKIEKTVAVTMLGETGHLRQSFLTTVLETITLKSNSY